MPWSEPRGGDNRFLSNGGPVTGHTSVIPSAAGLANNTDLFRTRYSRTEERWIINTAVANIFLGMENFDDIPVQFTNAPALGVIEDICINHAATGGLGFVFSSGASVRPWIASSCDPATATFAAMAADATTARGITSLAGGEIFVVDNGTVFNIGWSNDQGASWATLIINMPGASNDLQHANRMPIISPDGRVAAVYSPTGIAFLDTPSAGDAGLLGSMTAPGIITSASFNVDGTKFVYTVDAEVGSVRFTDDYGATVTTIAADQNPFALDSAGNGRGITSITYRETVPVGWILQANLGGESLVGFLPESDPTVIHQGISIGPNMINLNRNVCGDMDEAGNLLIVGNNQGHIKLVDMGL